MEIKDIVDAQGGYDSFYTWLLSVSEVRVYVDGKEITFRAERGDIEYSTGISFNILER